MRGPQTIMRGRHKPEGRLTIPAGKTDKRDGGHGRGEHDAGHRPIGTGQDVRSAGRCASVHTTRSERR